MLYIALHCHVNCIYALTSCADDESLIALEINTQQAKSRPELSVGDTGMLETCVIIILYLLME